MKDPYWYILALVCGLFIFTPGHIGIVAAPFIILAACLCLEVVGIASEGTKRHM